MADGMKKTVCLSCVARFDGCLISLVSRIKAINRLGGNTISSASAEAVPDDHVIM